MSDNLSSFKIWNEEDSPDVWDNDNPVVADRMTHIATQITVGLLKFYDSNRPEMAELIVEDAFRISEQILIQREKWIHE